MKILVLANLFLALFLIVLNAPSHQREVKNEQTYKVTYEANGGGTEISWKAPDGKWYPIESSPYQVGGDGKTNIERDPNYLDRFTHLTQ